MYKVSLILCTLNEEFHIEKTINKLNMIHSIIPSNTINDNTELASIV